MHLSFNSLCMLTVSHRAVLAVVSNPLKRIKAMIETQRRAAIKAQMFPFLYGAGEQKMSLSSTDVVRAATGALV